MEPSTLSESREMNYVDYVDAIRREGYLKSLQQAGTRNGPPGKRPGKGAADTDLIKKTEPPSSPRSDVA